MLQGLSRKQKPLSSRPGVLPMSRAGGSHRTEPPAADTAHGFLCGSLLVRPLRPSTSPCFQITSTPPCSNRQSNLCWRYPMYRDHKILCSREEKICFLHISPKKLSSRKSSYSFDGCIGHPSSLHHLCLKFHAYIQPKSRSALAFLCSFWGWAKLINSIEEPENNELRHSLRWG